MKKTIFLLFATLLSVLSVNAKTVYLNAGPWNTAGAVYSAWAWNTGDADAAGYEFDLVEGSLYKAELRDDASAIILLRKNPNGIQSDNIWAGEWNRLQTGIPTDKNCCVITGWGAEDYKWVTYPFVYYVAGAPASLFTEEWNGAHENNKMTLVDGIYTWTKTNVKYDEDIDCAFKVSVNGWEDAYPTDNVQFKLLAGKTYDITITYNPSTNAVDVATKAQVDPIMKTIYCKMEYSWWTQSGAAISAYVWGTGGGSADNTGVGTLMTLAPYEDNVWKLEVDIAQYQHVRFIRTDAAGTNDWGARSINTDIPADTKNLFTITNTDACWNSAPCTCDGEWSEYTELTEEQEATYILKGDAALGLNWTEDDTDNQMQKQGDGSYTLTKTDLELSAGAFYYKVIKNFSWSWSVPAGSDASNQLNIATAGRYDITFTLNAEKTELTANPTLKEELAIIPEISMHGQFANGVDWADTEVFTKSGDEKTASLTLSLAACNYGFGMKVGGSWVANGAAFTRANASAVVEAGAGNLSLQADVAGDYTFTWTYETNTLAITYPAAAANVTVYYVNVNDWAEDAVHCYVYVGESPYIAWPGEKMTKTGDKVHGKDVYSYTFPETYNMCIFNNNSGAQTANLNVDASKPYYHTETWYATLAEIPAAPNYSNQPDNLYFHPSSAWREDGARFAAYFYAGSNFIWKNMLDTNNDGIYEVENPKTHSHVIFVRMNPGVAENDWGNRWGDEFAQTYDLEIPNYAGGTLNTCYALFKNSWEDKTGTWVLPTPLTDTNYETILNDYQGKTVNIVVERQFLYDTSLSNEQWFTLCLPFSCPANKFGEAHQLKTIKENKHGEMEITTSKQTTIAAGAPYLILPPAGNDHVIVEEVLMPASVTTSTNTASGDGATVTMTPELKTNGTTGTYYWVGDKGYLYNDDVAKLGLRAYFTIPNRPSGMPQRFRIVANENQTTGVEDIANPEGQVLKTIVNGQLIIIRGGEMYNVQGQRL